MTRCRSCRREILWAYGTSGRLMPLDFPPIVQPKGFRLTQHPDGTYYASFVETAQRERLYTSHFATCPNAATHRKPR